MYVLPTSGLARFAQGFVDKAQLKSALTEAQVEAETCLASLDDAGASAEVGELRKQLVEARDAANSCLLQMGSSVPSDEASRPTSSLGSI